MSIYSNLLLDKPKDLLNLYKSIQRPLPNKELQASHIHLHPIVESEDGGSAGAVCPLFYITDGLIEILSSWEASDRGSVWS